MCDLSSKKCQEMVLSLDQAEKEMWDLRVANYCAIHIEDPFCGCSLGRLHHQSSNLQYKLRIANNPNNNHCYYSECNSKAYRSTGQKKCPPFKIKSRFTSRRSNTQSDNELILSMYTDSDYILNK